jgi:hypothetical protein
VVQNKEVKDEEQGGIELQCRKEEVKEEEQGVPMSPWHARYVMAVCLTHTNIGERWRARIDERRRC